MAAPQSLHLNTALRRSGVEVDHDVFASVGVRRVPRWLGRVWGSETEAMALPGVIFASPTALDRIIAGDAATLLTHESVHVEQWREHGIAGFLFLYVADYLRGRAVGLPHSTAYRAIRFERQATERTERK